MPEKWTEPKGAPPAWLDPADEVTRDDPKMVKGAFIATCVNALLAMGLSVPQAVGVTANACNETGYGRYYRANNLGGWKITKVGARAYRAEHGKGPRWWRAPGNKAPGATIDPWDMKGGDPPWCYYRAFDSIGAFLGEWVTHFVPKPGTPPPYAIYRRTGELFWRGDPEWFRLMCLAGYKGRNTQKHPDLSVAEHKIMCRSVATHWAQSRLRVVVDGAWGPKSRAACAAFQAAKGLPATGEATPETLAALAV
jgi:peptidoglycan hydrolase-like protein with peptidoglycan-binding domain